MKKEHAVSVSLTNGTECICNPDIILGDKHGLWDLDNEISPIGTLFDLNAAWELFISRKKFENISYRVTENSKGDKTYTLVDDNGNPTEAVFTIKNIDDQQIVSIQWQDGYLYIFYNRKRVITPEEESGTIPVEYVLDEQGHRVYDEETGKPLVYDNVKIPVIEIFDNHETHTLFPWFADDQHTVKLRQSVDNNGNNHLGDFAITRESEVFFAQQRYSPLLRNTLISLQSLNDQLQKTLGVGYVTVTDPSIRDTEGLNTYQRIIGDTLSFILNTEKKDSITAAIRGIQTTNDIAENLAFGQYFTDDEDETTFDGNITTHFSSEGLPNGWLDYRIPQNIENQQYTVRSLLGAINLIQTEIGDVNNLPVPYHFDSSNLVTNIVALDNLAKQIRLRVGWNNGWEPIDTVDNSSVTKAINELVTKNDNLIGLIGLKVNPQNYIQYINPDIHSIIKTRLNKTNNVKIIEAVNDIQNQIGDLNSLTTSEKLSLIGAINELKSNIGVINNLTTDVKTSLVGAINELDTHIDSNSQNIGNLSELNTTDKSDLVSAVNETLTNISQVSDENPFEVYKVGTSKKGVQVKGKNNQAETDSLVAGRSNSAGEGSFVFGYSNSASSGTYSIVGGGYNRNDGYLGIIVGEHNNIILQNGEESVIYANPEKNQIFGENNTITNALENFISGTGNKITGSIIKQGGSYTGYGENNKVLGNKNTIIRGSNIFILGDWNTAQTVVQSDKTLSGNYIFGKNHQLIGDYNFIIGDSINVIGHGNLIYGTELDCYVNNSIILMPSNANPAVFDYIDGETYIGGNINFALPSHSDQIQNVVFYDLNKFQKKFTNTTNISSLSELEAIIKLYYTHVILSEPHTVAKFKMGNYQGYVIFENTTSVIVHYHDTWVQTLDITATPVVWQVKGGETLKVIQKNSKSYLALGDQNFSEDIDPTIGPKTGSIQDVFSGWQAYGAIDLDNIWNAFDLTTKLNNKVNTSSVLTTVKDVNGTPTNITQPISSVTLDLINSFGFDKSLYQLRSEKGQANGYAPLDANGKVPATNLPSYVDDVIDVWAEYDISTTGELSNIHLYEYNSGTKGSEILQGESDKVYVQANGTIARQFRWSGSVWSPIGPAQLVLGEVQGTAYDGLKGKTTTDNVNSHIANTNNPHNVQASQLNVTINDPNDPNNLLGTSPYNVNYNVLTALQKLFDRVNISEDDLSSLTTLIGSVSEIEQLAGTSVIGAILDFTPMTNSEITTSVNTYFKFYGEN